MSLPLRWSCTTPGGAAGSEQRHSNRRASSAPSADDYDLGPVVARNRDCFRTQAVTKPCRHAQLARTRKRVSAGTSPRTCSSLTAGASRRRLPHARLGRRAGLDTEDWAEPALPPEESFRLRIRGSAKSPPYPTQGSQPQSGGVRCVRRPQNRPFCTRARTHRTHLEGRLFSRCSHGVSSATRPGCGSDGGRPRVCFHARYFRPRPPRRSCYGKVGFAGPSLLPSVDQ